MPHQPASALVVTHCASRPVIRVSCSHWIRPAREREGCGDVTYWHQQDAEFRHIPRTSVFCIPVMKYPSCISRARGCRLRLIFGDLHLRSTWQWIVAFVSSQTSHRIPFILPCAAAGAPALRVSVCCRQRPNSVNLNLGSMHFRYPYKMYKRTIVKFVKPKIKLSFG